LSASASSYSTCSTPWPSIAELRVSQDPPCPAQQSSHLIQTIGTMPTFTGSSRLGSTPRPFMTAPADLNPMYRKKV
jgi:hypothetical protein